MEMNPDLSLDGALRFAPVRLALYSSDLRLIDGSLRLFRERPDLSRGVTLFSLLADLEPESRQRYPTVLALQNRVVHEDVVSWKEGGSLQPFWVRAGPWLDKAGELRGVVELTLSTADLRLWDAPLRQQLERTLRILQEQDRAADRLMTVQQELAEKNAELEAAKAELERLSLTDALTGLANRRSLEATLGNEMRRAIRYHHPLSLLLLDLDHFKRVNDTYGHPVGDHVLRTVATILKTSLRETDTVARMGGEEFAVILPETRCEDAVRVAERLRSAVEAHGCLTPTGTLPLTISIGVAVRQEGESTLESFVARADAALYEAKRRGRNRVIVSEKA